MTTPYQIKQEAHFCVWLDIDDKGQLYTIINTKGNKQCGTESATCWCLKMSGCSCCCCVHQVVSLRRRCDVAVIWRNAKAPIHTNNDWVSHSCPLWPSITKLLCAWQWWHSGEIQRVLCWQVHRPFKQTASYSKQFIMTTHKDILKKKTYKIPVQNAISTSFGIAR